ncbi:MAG: RNA polymerase sigma factor [Lachnospiraceae bacterium]|nr:RNA polymerase sigma factor [Lachnospiraceae bacterium]
MNEGSIQEQLYRDYHDKIYSYVFYRVNSKEDAEDLVSEIFIKVIDKLDTFDEGKAGYSTWIYQIAKNQIVDYYRGRKIQEELPEELLDDSSLEEGYLNEETLSELAAALESLPKAMRDIIIYRYYHEKSLQEISEIMSLSYGAVKLRHRDALLRLKDMLGFENAELF